MGIKKAIGEKSTIGVDKKQRMERLKMKKSNRKKFDLFSCVADAYITDVFTEISKWCLISCRYQGFEEVLVGLTKNSAEQRREKSLISFQLFSNVR